MGARADKVRAFALIACVAVIGSLGIAAAGVDPSPTMSESPTSGPPGTTITVQSVDPCPLDSLTVVVFLKNDAHEVVASTSFTANADGTWQTTLVVPTDTPVGTSLEVGAGCVPTVQGQAAGDDDGGGTLYTSLTFEVTAPDVPDEPPPTISDPEVGGVSTATPVVAGPTTTG